MAVEFKDYYRILGVERTADDKTIKSAYRKLARKHHPDVAKGKDSGDRFREVAEAYEVLSDPEKRRRYDTLGPDWQRYTQPPPQGGQPGGMHVEYGEAADFSDFFRTIFGDLGGGRGAGRSGTGRRMDVEDLLGGFAGGGRRGMRGQDVQANVTITLEEAYSGVRKGFEFEIEEPCPTCHGSGNVGGKPCTTCHGSGWQRGRREVDVKIPAGVRTGQKVRVSGEGAGGGDLYLAVTVAPHRDFERHGDDIHFAVPITAPEAALGVSLEIPTLRGKVSMKIPPATSSGRTFRLPGYGMPKLKGGGHGNQLVTVRIAMPADLRPEERELYEKLRALRSDSPRGGYAQG
ncbi:MAG TPA: DnaJ C-terminal domain-containing protein [Candidatus Acidoferrum sp.]|jgi:DnaJ-class molecular chaperone|nr:DnaJ C-terminal domain-containing protein [Candidatus Acidoferrum sp.]